MFRNQWVSSLGTCWCSVRRVREPLLLRDKKLRSKWNVMHLNSLFGLAVALPSIAAELKARQGYSSSSSRTEWLAYNSAACFPRKQSLHTAWLPLLPQQEGQHQGTTPHLEGYWVFPTPLYQHSPSLLPWPLKCWLIAQKMILNKWKTASITALGVELICHATFNFNINLSFH